VRVTALPRTGITRFPIRIGPRSRPLLVLIFGVRERNAYVDLTDTRLDVHFGYAHFSAALANIAAWRIEGPWLWITAIGLRRGVRHGDWTFGGNHKAGVRIDFKEPQPWGRLHVPRVYVTVADLEGLGAALSERGISGADARRAQ
jgi:hypothetical protein